MSTIFPWTSPQARQASKDLLSALPSAWVLWRGTRRGKLSSDHEVVVGIGERQRRPPHHSPYGRSTLVRSRLAPTLPAAGATNRRQAGPGPARCADGDLHTGQPTATGGEQASKAGGEEEPGAWLSVVEPCRWASRL